MCIIIKLIEHTYCFSYKTEKVKVVPTTKYNKPTKKKAN